MGEKAISHRSNIKHSILLAISVLSSVTNNGIVYIQPVQKDIKMSLESIRFKSLNNLLLSIYTRKATLLI